MNIIVETFFRKTRQKWHRKVDQWIVESVWVIKCIGTSAAHGPNTNINTNPIHNRTSSTRPLPFYAVQVADALVSLYTYVPYVIYV